MTRGTTNDEALYSTLAGDADLAEIVAMFVDEMPQRAETIARQTDAGDLPALRRTAHQLKGAAGSYGFAPVSETAARIEQAVDVSEPEETIRALVEELAELCGRCRAGVPQP